MVDAERPHAGMVSTSIANLGKVFEIIHMLWIGKLANHHAFVTTIVDQIIGWLDEILGYYIWFSYMMVLWLWYWFCCRSIFFAPIVNM